MSARNTAHDVPWGIYVHVPWCRRRCSYCDFYFEVRAPDAADPERAFAPAVVRELDARRASQPSANAVSLYFGGGTPSMLAPEAIARIVAGARRAGLAKTAEVTLEANPEDLTAERVDAYRAAGINRLSLGVQSFQPAALGYLGRFHTTEQAQDAVVWAHAAGMDVSVDLIVGVPGDDQARLEADVAVIAEHGVAHASTYMLTREVDTPLDKLIARGKRAAIDEDAQVDMFAAVSALLERAGLSRYEVSNLARPGKAAVHNRLYWAQGTYLGLGPGAHGIALSPTGGVLRRHNAPDVARYLAAAAAGEDAPHETEPLAPQDALAEAIAFGLRDLERGIAPAALSARHQAPLPAALDAVWTARIAVGHLERGPTPDRVRLTAAGALFADGVARDVLGAFDP